MTAADAKWNSERYEKDYKAIDEKIEKESKRGNWSAIVELMQPEVVEYYEEKGFKVSDEGTLFFYKISWEHLKDKKDERTINK